MDDFARTYALNGVNQRTKERTVVFHAVPLDMDDDNSESEFLEIVFVLEAAIGGDENVTTAVGLEDQIGIGQGAPLSFGDRHDFVMRKCLAQARVKTFV
jgi:hypothetical protein